MRRALIIVDVQNDFCPGGALGVAEGDQIVAPLNAIISYARAHDWAVLFSRDWHPAVTGHFKEHGGMWPAHCVQDTPGAEFHKDLDVKDGLVVSKATKADEDGYSAFAGHLDSGKSLADYLNSAAIESVFVGGLATDYCVKATVLDSLKNDFATYFLRDGSRAVNIDPEDGSKAEAEMLLAGTNMRHIEDIVGK